MENKIKVGQTFEVVEVLTDGGFTDKNLFKIGGFSINFGDNEVLANGKEYDNLAPDGFNYNQCWAPMYDREIKPIGKLTITKVKQL